MAEQHLDIASLRDFPSVDFETWSRRVVEELDGAPLSSLGRPDPVGLGSEPLAVRDLAGAPFGRRTARGWRRVVAVESPDELAAARTDGAQAFEVPAARLASFGAELNGDLLVASHGDPACGEARACAVGGYDPLGALARDGGLPVPVEAALDSVPGRLGAADAGRPLRVDLGPIHRAGGHAVNELAYATAILAELSRSGGGCRPERLASGTALVFELGRDVFDTIAKLRAARVLWAQFFGAAGLARCAAPWIHVTTSTRSLEAREPMTNVLRATTQVFAAAVGGADSIRVRPHDEALGAPSRLGRRLALNLQLVLAEEAHLGRTADAAGGSYWIEARTDALARAAWARFQELERDGGYLRALRSGLVHGELDAAWRGWRARVAAGEAHVLGVTLHPGDDVPASATDAVPSTGPLEREFDPLPVRRDGDAARTEVTR